MRPSVFLLLALILFNFLQLNVGDLHNLIYWTPHKTGSESMRHWLREISSNNNLPTLISEQYYPYSMAEDWHTRSVINGKVANCTLIGGHIHALGMDERRKENELGRVITTTRDVMETYLSKYFHRSRTNFSENIYRVSAEREDLLRYFFGVDPCEVLRYYDGFPGCNLEETKLMQRVERIVKRIDCAIDTDDPQEDVGRLCEMMRVEKCVLFPRKNSKGEGRYSRIIADENLRIEMERLLKPAKILRQSLLSKKCANLKDEESGRWPHPSCRSL